MSSETQPIHQVFADQLVSACRTKGAPVCVGIDPVYERLPMTLRMAGQQRVATASVPSVSTSNPASRTPPPAQSVDIPAIVALEAIERYTFDLLEVVAPHVPCVKIQSACYERYHWRGVRTYERTIERAKQLGLLVIADAKRGDIGISAAHYAAGCLADPPHTSGRHLSTGPDALTINAYLGDDSIQPFIDVAAACGKGLFALVRTSNPGGDALQGLRLDDGRSVAEAVAQMIARLGSPPKCVGESGLSLLGAVVGATKADDAARLRELMPQQIFLVPGFGAQGGTADDLRPFFKPDATGALITASRSVIYAYENNDSDNWLAAVEEATVQMKQQIADLCGGS